MSDLTPMQQSFVELYVANLAQTNKKTKQQIAIAAGYSKKSAHSQATDNLKNPKILDAINDLLSEQSMPKNEVLYHFAQIARGDVKDSTLGDRLRALENLAKYHNLTNNNNVKISTWEDEAVEAIRNREIDFESFVETFQDEGLAVQLFKRAGVDVTVQATDS